MSDDVVVKAHVRGPEMDGWPAQNMRAAGATREECLHNIKIRAAEQSDLFGTDDVSEIEIEHAEVL